jgi:hypothetical protein
VNARSSGQLLLREEPAFITLRGVVPTVRIAPVTGRHQGRRTASP